jgi:hypothetical protein
VRPNLVVIGAPNLSSPARLEDIRERMHVEQFVADLAVKRFDVCVLRWFAGLNEVQSDLRWEKVASGKCEFQGVEAPKKTRHEKEPLH